MPEHKIVSDPERPLLKVKQLCARFGVTRQHIGREVKAGRFPRPIQLGPNTVRWSPAAIDAWVEEKKVQSGAQ
jgi:prophage regulatory protein